nr:anti-sigma regulatory factor [uncultured Duganella sp.]
MTHIERVRIDSSADIVAARGLARQIAGHIGFGLADQARLATAVSELARNALQYGGGGVCEIEDRSDQAAWRIHVVVEDHGPGIANVELALRDGYSTRGGLGAGLPGTRRLADVFDIASRPGMTRVSIALVRARGL